MRSGRDDEMRGGDLQLEEKTRTAEAEMEENEAATAGYGLQWDTDAIFPSPSTFASQ